MTRVQALKSDNPRAIQSSAMARDSRMTLPKDELGLMQPFSLVPWSNLFTGDMAETIPELQWPMNVKTYAAMIGDAQIEGLLYGATLPIYEYYWYVEPNGARQELVDMIAKDFNLPIGLDEAMNKERLIGRSRGRFLFSKFMWHAFRALVYGHYYFEFTVEVDENGYARLKKAAPRPPQTISDIMIENDGGLKSIKQNIGSPTQLVPEIPVDRLTAFIWDQEGANWAGRSLLRSLFKNWVAKDKLIRIDTLSAERFGMGIPIATGQPGAQGPDLQKLDVMARRVRSGKTAGGALPNGASMQLMGVQGSTPDIIAKIRYHDEQMSKRFLQTFNDANSTASSSRASSTIQFDFMGEAQPYYARWFADTANEHLVEKLVDLNFHLEEQVPLIRFAVPKDVDPLMGMGSVVLDPEDELALQEQQAKAKKPAPKQSSLSAKTPGAVRARRGVSDRVQERSGAATPEAVA